MFKGKNIGFGVTGSFENIEKAVKEIKKIKDFGATIYPIVSPSVFEHEDIVQKLKILSDTLYFTVEDVETFGPNKTLDALIIAPLTGNTLSKLSIGQADNGILMAAKSTLRNCKPLILGISTNDGLGLNGSNVMKLLSIKNIFFIPFGQDSPFKKPYSLDADLQLLIHTVRKAIRGKQIQPVIINRYKSKR